MTDARYVNAAATPVALHLDPAEVDDFRLMLREQLVDDTERLRDIEAGVDSTPETDVRRRIAFLWALAEQVGGVY